MPTPEKKLFMDFTTPVVISPYQFVVPYPQAESRLVAPIKPFQKEVWFWNTLLPTLTKASCSFQVWIAFFLTTAAFVVFLSLVTHRHDRNEDRPKSYAEHLSDNVLYIITVIIGNGKAHTRIHMFTSSDGTLQETTCLGIPSECASYWSSGAQCVSY